MPNKPTESTTADPIIRVLCVDDNPDMNAAFQLMIDAVPSMRCVGCLTSADRLIASVRAMPERPDVVLLDATMPGKGPLSAMLEMSVALPEVRVIVFSGHEGSDFVQRAKAAGAWGFVSKRHEPDFMIRAVREVAAGRRVWPDPSTPR